MGGEGGKKVKFSVGSVGGDEQMPQKCHVVPLSLTSGGDGSIAWCRMVPCSSLLPNAKPQTSDRRNM